MAERDPRIDTYINNSADFAKPVLAHIRTLVHEACPEARETIKWGFPHFEYHGILCSMASFKQHCSFGFWKASLMNDPEGILQITEKNAMGHMDKITSLANLPPDDIFKTYIMEAMRINEEGLKVARRAKKEKEELAVPDDFERQLKAVPPAWAIFQEFSYSNKKEYLEWLADARTMSTRASRMEKAVKQIAEGKIRHWKYVK
jgi:uncharacterized protein YdeI (YjbR/CyaY-like superfamily)